MPFKTKKGLETKSATITQDAPKTGDVKTDILERMEFKFELKDLIEDGQDNFIVKGYASRFNGLDAFDDRIIPGAYTDTITDHPKGFPALFMHDPWVPPIGLFFDLKEDNLGLLVEARLPKSDVFVKGRIIPQIKTGSINALSIGFFAKAVRFEEENGDSIRIIEKIELREISFVTLGLQADSGALLLDLKRGKDQTDEQVMFNAMVDVHRKDAVPAVKTKITEFYHEKGRPDPFADDSTISREELKNLTKSNLTYAIRELKLSGKASNYLAGLVHAPQSDGDDPKGGKAPTTDTKSSGTPSGDDVDSDGDTPEEKAKIEEAIIKSLSDLTNQLKNFKGGSNAR